MVHSCTHTHTWFIWIDYETVDSGPTIFYQCPCSTWDLIYVLLVRHHIPCVDSVVSGPAVQLASLVTVYQFATGLCIEVNYAQCRHKFSKCYM